MFNKVKEKIGIEKAKFNIALAGVMTGVALPIYSGSVAAAASSGIGNVATTFKQELSSVGELVMYVAYFAGVVFALQGLMKWYEKSQGQGGDQIKNKEIFIKLGVGTALLAFGWTMDTMLGSLGASGSGGTSSGIATFNK